MSRNDGAPLPAPAGMKHGGTRKFINKALKSRAKAKAAKKARRKSR